MKKRKRKLSEFARDFLQDGVVEPMEKLELEQWLYELDPAPSMADIMVLKRALVDTVATDLEKKRLTISAHQAVRGVDRMVEILLSHLNCTQASRVDGHAVDVHFTGLWEAIEAELQKAEIAIDIAAFTLSYNPMRDMLFEMADKKIPVRILTEDGNLFQSGSDISDLAKHPKITVKTDGPNSYMHHKFRTPYLWEVHVTPKHQFQQLVPRNFIDELHVSSWVNYFRFV